MFYFGIVADITPPVALAAYAGSAIAKADPMKTGLNATRLAIAAFIVPYIFAFSPAMLFEFERGQLRAWQVVQIILSALLGLFGIAAALNGNLYRHIPWLFRVALAGGRPLHDDPRHRQRPHRLFAGGGRRGLAEGRGQEDPCRRLRADIPSLRERERTLGVCR